LNSAEKKTRRNEDKADLQAMITGTQLSGAALRTYLFDNVDVSQVANKMAAYAMSGNIDCCHKNYYVYRDSEGDGEWEMLPWDVDLSFGRNWRGACSCYWDDQMYWDNDLFVGGNATLPSAIFNGGAITATRQMYLRRVRSIMDEYLQHTNVPPAERILEKRISQLTNELAPDGLLDLQKWGTWTTAAQGPIATNHQFYQNVEQATGYMLSNYLNPRRVALFTRNTAIGGSPELPDAQPSNVVVTIGAVESRPASGNQAEEYIQIINNNAIWVDLTGWRLTGAVTHTFQAGVVIPPTGSSNQLFVVPDKKAFRARATAPRGGMGLYVEGPYQGQLSARGETIYLTDKTGRLVTTNAYPGAPSGPQAWLRITEIMYHPPAPPSESPYEAEDFEYIEFLNTGPTNISLAGVHFTNGLEFAFPAMTLAPGVSTLIVRNLDAFMSRYGTNLSIAGVYVGILNNGGENLRIDDAVGEKILDFAYDNAWYPVTDGPGSSLVIRNAAADWRSWDYKESWRPSAYDFGSPAATDPPTNSWLPVIVHEVLTHTDLPFVDAIELFNPNAVPVDIGGWFLSDDFAAPKKFRVPDGSVIPAGGFFAFDETSFNPMPGVPPSFAFSGGGDEVFVFSGNGTNLTGWVEGQIFGAAGSGISFGRYTNSEGALHFVAMSSTTFSNHNALPKVGPVVISEVLYHPPDLPSGDNAQDEFIELANISGAAVPLFDPANHTNTWRLRSAVDFDFPTNATLAADGYALVVSFSPANAAAASAFRTRFGVSTNVPLFGPWSGKLDNSAESVRLYRPDAPLGGEVPYVLVDRLDYRHDDPWPVAADTLGGSLQRIVAGAYGNDVTNWTGAAPSAGDPFVPGMAPTVTVPPASQSAPAGGTATFNVSVAGTPPFAYQWQFNSNNIPGANSSVLTLTGIQLANAGYYRVAVLGAGGSVESSNALLTVFIPATVTQQPTNQFFSVPPDPRTPASPASRVAVFRVTATSTNSALAYQWRKNGTNLVPGADPDITGETTDTLTVSNVTMASVCWFSCAVTDIRSTVVSSEAVLGVKPYMLVPHSAQTIAVGDPISVNAVIQAFPPPYLYKWQRANSYTNAAILSSSTTNFVTFDSVAGGYTNTAGSFANSYNLRLLVTNLATTAVGDIMTNLPAVAPTTLLITVLADTDGDGIPNQIEAGWGMMTNNPADAPGDLDGDGVSNVDEFRAGTDATNAASLLKVTLSTMPGVATVSFGAISNRNYTIEYTDALPRTPPWSRLADVLTRPTNSIEMIVDPTWTSNRFYRAVTPRQ